MKEICYNESLYSKYNRLILSKLKNGGYPTFFNNKKDFDRDMTSNISIKLHLSEINYLWL